MVVLKDVIRLVVANVRRGFILNVIRRRCAAILQDDPIPLSLALICCNCAVCHLYLIANSETLANNHFRRPTLNHSLCG